MPKPAIIIDTREQQPLVFNELRSVTRTLHTGDYSIAGAEHLFAVERKSLSDLASSCTKSNRPTFERELCRLRGYQFRRLLIIGKREDAEAQKYRSNIKPDALLGSLDTFEVRYDIPVVWTDNPVTAASLIERWAKKFASNISKVSYDISQGIKPPSPALTN